MYVCNCVPCIVCEGQACMSECVHAHLFVRVRVRMCEASSSSPLNLLVVYD